jgi:hypothetical protein
LGSVLKTTGVRQSYLLPHLDVLLLHRVHAERRLQLAHASRLVLGHLDEGRLRSSRQTERRVGQSERTMCIGQSTRGRVLIAKYTRPIIKEHMFVIEHVLG